MKRVLWSLLLTAAVVLLLSAAWLPWGQENTARAPEGPALQFQPEKPEAPEKKPVVLVPEQPDEDPQWDPWEGQTPLPPKAEPPATLQPLLDQLADGLTGVWDIRVENLVTGETAACRVGAAEDAPMVSASLIKLFIMAAVYEQVEAGQLSHDAVDTALYHMITVSDNVSANTLIRQLGGGDTQAGMAVVNDYAARLGCSSTSLNRLMLENNGLQNYTSAADCALLLRQIYTGSCVSPARSEEMLELLKAQQINDRIPAGLPEGVVCAHKTGDLTALCNADAGIVFTEQGAYILCLLSNWPSGVIGTMTDLSEAFYTVLK